MRCAREACGGDGKGSGGRDFSWRLPSWTLSSAGPEVGASKGAILVGFSRENEGHPKSGDPYTKETSRLTHTLDRPC